jgi:hypothetical protein
MGQIVKILVAAAALALAFSCGSSEESASSGNVPLEQVQREWRKAVCAKIYGCCSADERARNDEIGTDAADCEGKLEGEYSFFLGDIQTSVAQGRVVYHGDKMAACLANLKARTCEQAKAPPGELDVTQLCDGVFEPKVPVGGACLEFWDCASGWCAGDLGNLMDTCSAKLANGEVCDEGVECTSGICVGNKCITRPPGSGNICNFGITPVGEHTPGIPP